MTSTFFSVALLFIHCLQSVTCARVSVSRLLQAFNADEQFAFDHGDLNGSISSGLLGPVLPSEMMQAASPGLLHLFTSVGDSVVEHGSPIIAAAEVEHPRLPWSNATRWWKHQSIKDANHDSIRIDEKPQQASIHVKTSSHKEPKSSALVSLGAAMHRAKDSFVFVLSARGPSWHLPDKAVLLKMLLGISCMVCCLWCCLGQLSQSSGRGRPAHSDDAVSDATPGSSRKGLSAIKSKMKAAVDEGKVSRGTERSDSYRFGDFSRGILAKATGTAGGSPRPTSPRSAGSGGRHSDTERST